MPWKWDFFGELHLFYSWVCVYFAFIKMEYRLWLGGNFCHCLWKMTGQETKNALFGLKKTCLIRQISVCWCLTGWVRLKMSKRNIWLLIQETKMIFTLRHLFYFSEDMYLQVSCCTLVLAFQSLKINSDCFPLWRTYHNSKENKQNKFYLKE